MDASLQEYGPSAHQIQHQYCLEKHLFRHMQPPLCTYYVLSSLFNLFRIRSQGSHGCPQDAAGGVTVPLCRTRTAVQSPVPGFQPHLLLLPA